MTRRFSEWMSETGPDKDIVLSSRVRLARNLREIAFPERMNKTQAESLLNTLQNVVKNLGAGWKLHMTNLVDLSSIDRTVLVEKHLASPMLIQEPVQHKAVAIDDRESISILINEEDHLRIQVLLPALQLDQAWRVATQIDDALEAHLDFAYSSRSGYLTACPTNLGTAMRASVMIHLPALVLTRQAPQVFTTLSQIGMVVRGLYGEGSEALGNIFQISNQVSLGLSEHEFIHNLSLVAQQIVGRERHARQHLLENAGIVLADRVSRAWGTLTHARILSSEEALKLLSEVKLGQDLGILTKEGDATFAQLTVMTRPAFLQQQEGRPLSARERDEIRATTLRAYLSGQTNQ